MELVLRVGGHGVADTSVAVSIDGVASGSRLIEVLSDHLGVRGTSLGWWWVRTGADLESVEDLALLEPRDGDRLLLAPRDSGAPLVAPVGEQPCIDVVGGPSKGLSVVVLQGETIVGRGSTNGLRLADDAISRQHCRFIFDGSSVWLEDLGSTNGTKINGQRITGMVQLAGDETISLGESQLRILIPVNTFGSLPSADVRWADGAVMVNRPARVIIPSPAVKCELPAPPEVVAKRPIPLVMMLLPLLMGAVMFGAMYVSAKELKINQLIGPMFMLMSPVMLLANHFSQRKEGGRSAADLRDEYEERFVAIEAQLTSASAASRQYRLDISPSPDALLHWSTATTSRLWERRPRDSDFLDLRLGCADQPSLIETVVPVPSRKAEEECVERNKMLASQHTIDLAVPVSVALEHLGVIGLHGALDLTAASIRSLVLQIAALHSPADVAIVGIVPNGSEPEWSWLSWLPQCAVLSGSSGRSVVTTSDAAGILDGIDAIISAREGALAERAAVSVRSPRIVLVLPESDLLPAARLGRILERGPNVGVLALAGAGSAPALPGECQAILGFGSLGASVTWPRTGQLIDQVSADLCGTEMLEEASLAMAPLRDPSAGSGAGVPTAVICEEIAVHDMADSESIRKRWEMPDGSLSAPIGLTAGGTLSISLRRDGPHGVVAGTTGAGKSEFLQTFIASLAAHHSPERLALVLIDLKGGAAFQDLALLPHTVGFFTDLDEHLAARALISLNAELRRREEILRISGVKDLVDLEATGKLGIPPSLLIVFDEFAVIKTEMPDFIEGIVDIARRGRSLGVHMILATQSPTGVVDHHIRANTNLRVALRTANAAESQEIIERRDAADIPREITGRAWVRIGQDEPTLVQTAYSGRRAHPDGVAASVTARSFGLSGAAQIASAASNASTGSSDAQKIIESAVKAAESAGITRGAAPWLPPLPELVATSSISPPSLGRGALPVALGIVDEPTRQAQDPLIIDLANDGNLAIFGATGSGKTTALRTLVAGIVAQSSPDDARFVVFDFASRGLRSLDSLPHTMAYVTSDEPELLERVLARLTAEISRRREVVAMYGAATFSEARANSPELNEPFLVVILDGLAAFNAEYIDVDLGVVVDDFARIATDGPSAGVFVVVTVDRRSGLSMALASAISQRVVLRMTEDDDYISLGVPEGRKIEFTVGRGVIAGGGELQVAVLGANGSAAAQQEALAGLAPPSDVDTGFRIGALPSTVMDTQSLTVGWQEVPFAVDALLDTAVSIDLDDSRWFLVAGPDQSGRSTALSILAEGWRSKNPGAPTFLIAPRRTILTSQSWTGIVTEPSEVGRLSEQIQQLLTSSHAPALLVIDDGDQLTEPSLGTGLDELLRKSRDAPLTVLVAATSHGATRAFSGWLRDIRNPKRGILLDPDPERDGEIFGGRLPRRVARSFPPGRGYLVSGSSLKYVQITQNERAT